MLEQAAIAGYEASIGYSLDSLDHRDPGAPAVVETVGTATGGEIVSLHFGHPGTIEAMPAILDGLDRRGLEPVTVSRL
jgi:peptidoglycan/xylan/chitin deacetylase (PgdA/CDA1 family)